MKSTIRATWVLTLEFPDILALPELKNKLLNQQQSQGFIAALAVAPYEISPHNWINYLWGGEVMAPFSDASQLDQYMQGVVQIWDTYRSSLLKGTWEWPETCDLSKKDLVNKATRDFCEGLLQGWKITQDDWEVIMPNDSEDNRLLGGFLLSVSLLYDQDAALSFLAEQGFTEKIAHFEEIFYAIPSMLCALSNRAHKLALKNPKI